uniref:Uncharacterized protein n=1 Tax=Timema genevievae TaxID=629358 RepID=A0A7R9JUA1_TIMGE|nr:unnamed protein product [Timema genevievae]
MKPRSGDWAVTIDFLQEAAITALINLAIDPKVASGIVALRPALESMVIRASKEPETITELSPLDEKVVNVIRQLVKLNAGRYDLDPVGSGGGFVSRRPPRGHMSRGFDDGPPAKRMRGGGEGLAAIREVAPTEALAATEMASEEVIKINS